MSSSVGDSPEKAVRSKKPVERRAHEATFR
jgi:hypothetical protein